MLPWPAPRAASLTRAMPTASSCSLAFTLNGRPLALEVPAHALLLDVLRDRLGLKGARRSCDVQVCGACTVLVGGAPVSACTYLAAEVDGREVLTVEGLADGDALHPLQEAFIEHGAVQCGFCTAGMLLSAKALLDQDPAPTRERIAEYLRGNLCRCTGYRKIVDAIHACAAGGNADRCAASGPERVRTAPAWWAASVRRLDAPEKVTGRARYVTDLSLPGMLHVRLLRSPYPHARILRVDGTRARAATGVHLVATSADLGWCEPYFGPAFRDRPILAIDIARHEGEPVAAVVAESDEAAAEAARPDRGRVRRAARRHYPGGSAGARSAAGAHGRAPGRALRGSRHASGRSPAATSATSSTSSAAGPAPPSPRPTSSWRTSTDSRACSTMPWSRTRPWPPGTRRAASRVWAATQNPYSVRVELARMFRVPLGRIRIIVPPLGGGFGGKTYAKLEPMVGALARMVGRPVRLALSAEEAFHTVRRCDARARVRVGFRRDGTLLAAECHADFDVGAYADIGPRIIQKGTYTATGPYRVPHIALHARAVYTNTTPGGAFRGFGVPQLAWALESLIDEAARRLDRDPVDLRRQNLLGHGEEFFAGDTPIDGKFEESLNRVAAAIRWSETPAAGRGRGVAMMLKASIGPTVSEAIVRLHADASVTVLASTVEMGQGARTVLAQIAAEVLAVPVERVTVATPDTAITPYDQTTSSSRSTTLTGRAVQEAAADVRDQLLRVAGLELGAEASAMHLDDASVRVGERRLTYPELLELRFGMSGGELIGRGVVAPGRSAAPLGGSTPFWEMAAGAAEVSVDEETGAVVVEDYVSVADVGRSINPLQCEGQDEGAVVQGLGHTLLEEMAYEAGSLINASLAAYRVPRADDVPPTLRCHFVENADGAGPFGAKGAGEGSLVPVSPAVGNALARLTGVRFRNLPLTPERVWRALRARRVGTTDPDRAPVPPDAGPDGRETSCPK